LREEMVSVFSSGLRRRFRPPWPERGPGIELSEGWPELDDVPYRGLSVSGIVIRAADEALAAAGEDREEREKIGRWGLGFISGYSVLFHDKEGAPKIQTATSRAILNTLLIGMSLGDPKRRDKIVLESKRMQAAKMRAAKEAKAAPEREKILAAVRAAMQATTRTPTRGEGYAKLIRPKVVKHLGRDISPSSVREYVRVILEEAPGKPGKP
jgi:hypothetical protein